MTLADMTALLPLMVLAATPVAVMLAIAAHRSHALASGITMAGLFATLAACWAVWPSAPRPVGDLFIVDRWALFYMGLVAAAALVVTMISRGYLERRTARREEYYVLLTLAAAGAAALVASRHVVSFVLGLELLSVSLYALVAYVREEAIGIEAGMKYLVLGGTSSAFLLFGAALVYADTGRLMLAPEPWGPLTLAGFAMVLVGVGFKLAIVPFHLWTPDVYEGASAPVTAFVATVSKGAVLALVVRWFGPLVAGNAGQDGTNLATLLSALAVASMFAGNLLALRQENVKRMLAYSSIAHMGYLFVALLAGGALGATAVSFYLVAYFVTTLGAFGVIAALSTDRDADRTEDFRGLYRRRPWLAMLMTAMLLSLAGIPLTAGFIGKFTLFLAGVGGSLWLLVICFAINSTIGLFYYLRLVATIFKREGSAPAPAPVPTMAGIALAALGVLLLALGIWPGPLIELVRGLTP